MNKLIGILMLVLAALCTACFVYMALYVFGFKKGKLLQVKGQLVKIVLEKQAFRGHALSGKWHKYWAQYTYTYCVKGKTHRVTGGVPGKGTDLPNTVAVCVQKNLPAFAYIPKLEQPPSVWIPVFLLIGTVLLYAVAFGVLYL